MVGLLTTGNTLLSSGSLVHGRQHLEQTHLRVESGNIPRASFSYLLRPAGVTLSKSDTDCPTRGPDLQRNMQPGKFDPISRAPLNTFLACKRSDPTIAEKRCIMSMQASFADSPVDFVLSGSGREASRWWTTRARSHGPHLFRSTVARSAVPSGLSTGRCHWTIASLGWVGVAVSHSAKSTPYGRAFRHVARPCGAHADQPPLKPTTKEQSAVHSANKITKGMLRSCPSPPYLASGIPKSPQQCSTWDQRNKCPSQTRSCIRDRASCGYHESRTRLFHLLHDTYFL